MNAKNTREIIEFLINNMVLLPSSVLNPMGSSMEEKPSSMHEWHCLLLSFFDCDKKIGASAGSGNGDVFFKKCPLVGWKNCRRILR